MKIAVIGEFRLPPEKLDEARPLMRKVIEATRAEAGCEQYAYAEDVLDPGLIRISEIWTSRAHIDAHFSAPHMAVWGKEREALGMTGRVVRIYETSAEEVL